MILLWLVLDYDDSELTGVLEYEDVELRKLGNYDHGKFVGRVAVQGNIFLRCCGQ